MTGSRDATGRPAGGDIHREERPTRRDDVSDARRGSGVREARDADGNPCGEVGRGDDLDDGEDVMTASRLHQNTHGSAKCASFGVADPSREPGFWAEYLPPETPVSAAIQTPLDAGWSNRVINAHRRTKRPSRVASNGPASVIR